VEVAVPAYCSIVTLMIGQERRSSAALFLYGGDDDTPDQTFSWRAGRTKRGRRGSHPGGKGGIVQWTRGGENIHSFPAVSSWKGGGGLTGPTHYSAKVGGSLLTPGGKGDGHPLNPRHVQGSDGNCGGVEGAWGWLRCEERMKRGRQGAGGLHTG
jgi:hypothetical protein